MYITGTLGECSLSPTRRRQRPQSFRQKSCRVLFVPRRELRNITNMYDKAVPNKGIPYRSIFPPVSNSKMSTPKVLIIGGGLGCVHPQRTESLVSSEF